MRPRTLLLPALLLSSLFLGSAAAQPAPPLAPPSGPVLAGPADPYGAPGPGVERPGRRPHRDGQVGPRAHRGAAIRAALLARFDRDGDGRLTGRERMQAKRFVKHQRRMMRQERRGGQ